MTLWIAWSVFTSTLVGMAAAAVDQIAANLRTARRFGWISAIIIAAMLPPVLSLQAPRTATARATGQHSEVAAVAAVRDGVSRHQDPYATWARLTSSIPFRRVDVLIARLWIGTSIVLLLIFARRVLALRRIISRSSDEDTEIGRVLVSRDAGPAVVGFLRPRIVVPRWVFTPNHAGRGFLLRHELEHVRARDTLVLLLPELAIIAFPWNAALWWMARRLALAVEIDCDARVIRATHEPYAYGLTLLSVAERHTVALPLATRLFESRLNIEARLDAMTTPVRRYPMATSLPYAAIALIVLATTAWAPRPDSLRARTRGEAASPSPRPLPGNPAPRYPERLRIDGIEGGVIVEFSVNARGIPDTSTVRTVESTHEFFAAAVRTVVPLWRFDSAGVVRVPVRFLTARTEEKERAGQRPPKFANDPGPLETIVVVTIR